MKYVVSLLITLGAISAVAQNSNLEKQELQMGDDTYYYHMSSLNSSSLVILFHDWFGVSDLSYEMADRINDQGMDVIIMDLYKGKSAKTNPEAAGLMNSINQAQAFEYIDEVMMKNRDKYEKIILWGFSLGTIPASQTAINYNQDIDGLILFYGNVTQDKSQLEKISFPSLMVMGSADNPNGAINFYKSVNELGGEARLFIYPKARHAFAQKLFGGGANYNEQAKVASLEVAFRFLSELR